MKEFFIEILINKRKKIIREKQEIKYQDIQPHNE
jgi:hypothetical protein